MKQLRPALLLCISLLMVACGKDTPKPAPDLLGRWNAESTEGFNYSASGKLESQVMQVTKDYYMVITQDSLSYRELLNGSNWGKDKYTRQGNEIRYGIAHGTITELTEHALTLRFVDPYKKPNTPYQEVEDYYTR
jgi:hypothetical protein